MGDDDCNANKNKVKIEMFNDEISNEINEFLYQQIEIEWIQIIFQTDHTYNNLRISLKIPFVFYAFQVKYTLQQSVVVHFLCYEDFSSIVFHLHIKIDVVSPFITQRMFHRR